jgi:PAS domain S-box-containing protein
MAKSRNIETSEIYLETLGAYCISSCSPLFDSDGKLEFIIHSITDISERSKREEEENRESEHRFARRQTALLELVRGYDADLSSALRKIDEVSARTLGVERASVWRFNSQASAILCDDLYILSKDTHESLPDMAVKDYPRYFAALAGGRQVAADNARADERTLELAPGYLEPLEIASLLDAPIRRNGELVGVLCLEQVGGTRIWTSGDKEFAASVADQATLALEAMERRQVEESLKRGEQRLRNVIAGTNAGTWEWDIQTGEASVDKKSASFLGYSLDELQPFDLESWMSLKHPDDRKEATELLLRHSLGETESYSFESRMRHKEGDWVWILGRGKVSDWDEYGKPLRMFGTHIDITERKQAEERITKLLAEKESILKEVHHRIKNNMSTMMSLLSLQSDTMNDPAAAAALKDAENRLRSMGVLYDKLYHSENLSEMSTEIYLPTLVREIVSVFPNCASVRIEMLVDDFMIGVKVLSSLGIILNEILTNAMKYAFTGRDGGLIRVSASREGSRATIVIEDDGRGIPESVDIDDSPGFGLTLIGILTKQLGGTIRIERKSGTKYVLEFEI